MPRPTPIVAAYPLLVKKLFLLLLSLVLALGALELMVRWFGIAPRQRDPMHQFDSALGWSKRPNHRVRHRPERGNEFDVEFMTNDFGMRDEAVPEPKPEGEQRILFVGDSFTLGYTVASQDTFVRKLQDKLRAGGKTVRCLNGGTEGYATDQAALWFDRVGRRLHANLVVYVFYQNDLYWNLQERYGGFAKPRFAAAAEGGAWAPANLPLPDLGAFQRPWTDSLDLWRLLRRPEVATVEVEVGGTKAKLPAEFCVSLATPPKFVDEAFAATEGILAWWLARCTEAGCGFALVAIPDKSEIYEEDLDKLLAAFAIKKRDWRVAQPRERVLEIAERLGIKTQDPRQAFARSLRTPLYFDQDRHLSPHGNEVLAASLVYTIDKDRWLP
jgi:hypothetical protein